MRLLLGNFLILGILLNCLLSVELLLLLRCCPADSEEVKIIIGIILHQLPSIVAEVVHIGTSAVLKAPDAQALDLIPQHWKLLIQFQEANFEGVDV